VFFSVIGLVFESIEDKNDPRKIKKNYEIPCFEALIVLSGVLKGRPASRGAAFSFCSS
jgi:hypothetical protein